MKHLKDEALLIRRAIHSLVRLFSPSLTYSERRCLYIFVKRGWEQDAFEHLEAGQGRGLRLELEVACLAGRELHLDVDSLLALLLFRPLVQEAITEREIEEAFGLTPFRLIQSLRRTSALYLRRESISSENFHNLLLSMAEDIRVVLLIIADRLYRLRHARELYNDEESLALAVEVSFLYAPIAHRLGLYKIKGEMEDLCLKWRDRKTFDFIVRKLGETKEARNAYIGAFIAPLEQALRSSLDVPFELKGRTKSISSIHNKLRKQQFEDIYDLFAIRIILDDVPPERERSLCWQVYSVVTDMYRPNPERLKDWISIPKSNGYESLHITVMGADNRWVEVQIRTRRMDAVAEQGVAAHWRYKGIKSEGGLDEFLASVRSTLEAVGAQTVSDKRTFLENSMMTLSVPEIYVFTPRGEVIKLPKGATVLDFAYEIHSKVGAQAISGKVNGKNVSLKYQLQNGDAVEILTSQQQRPKKDWLSFVVSSKARASIRQRLRADEEAGISVAKELIQRRLKNRKLPFNESLFVRLAQREGYKAISDFYKAIASEKLDVQGFIDKYEGELRQQDPNQQAAGANLPERGASEFVDTPEDITHGITQTPRDILIIDQGLSGVEYSFAKCCQPVFGDRIFGFISSKGIKIHRVDCPNAPDMIERTGHRVLPARWSGNEGQGNQLVQIEVIGRDDLAVVAHVVALIKKEKGIQLRNYTIDSGDGLFRGTFVTYVAGVASMTNLMKKIRGAVGVKQVDKL